MPPSSRELHFLRALRAHPFGCRLDAPVQQLVFHSSRKWRFDFAWPAYMVAVEVHGGIFVKGGHNRGRGLMNDCEKLRAAAVLGWTVLPVGSVELDEKPVQVIDDLLNVIRIKKTGSI